MLRCIRTLQINQTIQKGETMIEITDKYILQNILLITKITLFQNNSVFSKYIINSTNVNKPLNPFRNNILMIPKKSLKNIL